MVQNFSDPQLWSEIALHLSWAWLSWYFQAFKDFLDNFQGQMIKIPDLPWHSCPWWPDISFWSIYIRHMGKLWLDSIAYLKRLSSTRYKIGGVKVARDFFKKKGDIPLSPLFVCRRILLLRTERTTGSSGFQVELRHVWHCEVDWTVVPDKREGNHFKNHRNNFMTAGGCWILLTDFLPTWILNLDERFTNPPAWNTKHRSFISKARRRIPAWRGRLKYTSKAQ